MSQLATSDYLDRASGPTPSHALRRLTPDLKVGPARRGQRDACDGARGRLVGPSFSSGVADRRRLTGISLARRPAEERPVLAVLVALLVLTVLGLPAWPYSSKWSYVPSGAFGFIAVALAMLVVLGRL